MKKIKPWEEFQYSSRNQTSPVLCKGIYVGTIPKKYRKTTVFIIDYLK